MSLTDGLVVLAVLGSFVLLILAKMNNKYPDLIPRFKEWMSSDKQNMEKSIERDQAFKRRIYEEKSMSI